MDRRQAPALRIDGRSHGRILVGLLLGMGTGWALARSARQKAALAGRVRWALPAGESHDGALAARTIGAGSPATLLLHGMFASGRYWGAAYDGLGRNGLLVVPDLAGFGRSVEVEGYGPAEHAELIALTVDQLGASDRPAVVGAHSLGCLIALRLAAGHPGLVAGIVAFSPPLYASPGAARRHLRSAHVLMGLLSVAPRLTAAVCSWLCTRRRLAARLGRLLRPDLPIPLAEDRLQHTHRSSAETLTKVIVAAGGADWLSQVTIPVHLIAGDRDTVVDRGFLAELARRHDHVSFSVWAGAEHELPLTHPEACVAEIERLQDRIGAG